MKLVNRNMLWASVIVDELARAGLDTAVIAPGSRSTPLVLALADDPRIKCHSVIDERSAAFFALGYALETGKPAALVCSSGTATANFYPAIVEAHYANVPMLVLTADRPHELRDSGANQTVDQVRMYGHHVLWSVDVAPPESNPSGVMIRSLRTMAGRAYATALAPVGGVVHLNFPLRKPLEPIPVETDNVDVMGSPRADNRPYTVISRGNLLPTASQIDELFDVVKQARRALVIAGPRTPEGDLPKALAGFAVAAGFPVLADPLSNLRWSPDIKVIGGYDTFLPQPELTDSIDLIIHIGALPASKALEDFFIRNSVPNVILVTENGVWTDPYHRLTHLVHADPTAVFDELAARINMPMVDDLWAAKWRSAEMATWAGIAENRTAFFDGGIVGEIAARMPDESRLFVASSLPVRHLEQYGMPEKRRIRVFCNRGASGIDGTISSAFGVAAASPAPTVLITGDLAFYHDMNGLLSAKRTGAKLIVVLVNNDGGGIFKRLPIADFEPQFTDLFLTPHGLDFEPAAKLYGLDYARTGSYDGLREAFAAALESKNSVIIEARTNAENDAAARSDLTRRIIETLTN